MSKKMKHLISENVDFNEDGKIKSLDVYAPFRLNLGIVILVLVMMAFGILMLFSASMPKAYTSQGNSMYYVIRQGKFLLAGFVVAAVIAFLPIKKFDFWPFTILVFFVALGVAVWTMVKGEIVNGARRWVFIGGTSFQTSELIKIAIVFFIAGYRSGIQRLRKKGKLVAKKTFSQSTIDAVVDITFPGMCILVVLGIVLAQPHMSCFLILCAVSFVSFLCCGIPFRSWLRGGALLLAIGIIGLGGFYLTLSSAQREKIQKNFEHVVTRLNIFSTMNSDEEEGEEKADEDETYQSNQSIIAVGSGGLKGVGFGNSRQKYMYLPEAHNDYVYSIICEELGFVGGVSVLILFWLFMIGGFYVSWRASSLFSRVLTAGYTSLITLQAFLNVAVDIGAIPPTGITLPFFSFGGTANFFFMIAVGIILSVSRSGTKRKTMKLVV
ncbi:MAG: FtsW/RodA/SpoVE family cell cycle protein [Clostridiales bacterium]|nr:FtsW/RodA/SpoVE family cell cycle protein [Clostridiales bacterium]